MPRFRAWPSLFVLSDVLVLYGGLLAGYKMHSGNWMLPHTTEWSLAAVIVMGIYFAALVASGAYNDRPRDMALSSFLDIGTFLVGGWGVSITVTYLVSPSDLPPRGMMIFHGLVALIGVLGYRAVLHRLSPTTSTSETPASNLPSQANVELDDFVSRPPVSIDRSGLRDILSDRTVLVTGAGGSIGSALSEQLLELNPFRLVLVDVSEHNLYDLETSLRSRSYDGDLEFCIADVRDETVMDGLMAREQPDIVIHAAAYKHVPLMERHPAEAFRNNTMATVHLLRLCEENDVDQFVFVSTDKAVAPKSVLGATKQLAEWYVRTASPSMQTTTVRFGNVFGSQGSVIPRFEKKLAAGEPLPLTHPDMERYFMTSEEACELILQVLLFNEYPLYLLKMGDPIRIEWLAKRLIERWHPHVDPQSLIEYVGRRPGEKLREQLAAENESVHATDHPSILGLTTPILHRRTELETHFERLRSLHPSENGSRTELRHALLNTAPASSLTPSSS